MKRFVLFAAGLALFASDLAIAQHQAQQRPHARPSTKPAPPHARPVKPKPGNHHPGKPNRPGRPGNGHRPGVRPPTTKPTLPHVRPVRPGHGHRPGVRPPGNGHHRPIVRPPHRPGFRPPHFRPIHGPSFHYPRGYRYRRWSVGGFLPSIFLGSSYYYNNYAGLGLGAPQYGYRWIRYGPDLLLVNIRTRRVRDVIYGAFY